MQAGFKVATHKEGHRGDSSWTASWNGSSRDASSSGRGAGTCLKLQWTIPTCKRGRALSWCTVRVRELLNHTSCILRVSYTARCNITHLSPGSCYCLPFRFNCFFFRHSSSYSVAANFSDHSKCLVQYQLQDWLFIAYISLELLSLLQSEYLASIDRIASPWVEVAGNFETA